MARPLSAETDTTNNPADALVTTVLVNNLHCASCVAYIKEVLRDLTPLVWDVDSNILAHEVRMRHDSKLSTTVICQSLNEAAFEIFDAITTDAAGNKVSEISVADGGNGWLAQAAGYWRRSQSGMSSEEKKKRHIQNCEACRQEGADFRSIGDSPSSRGTEEKFMEGRRSTPLSTSIGEKGLKQKTDAPQRRHPRLDHALSDPQEPGTGSANSKYDRNTRPLLQKSPEEQPFVVIHRLGEDFPDSGPRIPAEEYLLVLSISGMTCASCTGTISDSLKALDFVMSVNVTLLTNSATVIFTGPKKNANRIVERVEEMGYDTSIESCSVRTSSVQRKPPESVSENLKKLKATLSIGGMTCASCTGSVYRGLEELDFVESVAIDLLTNSGVVVFTGTGHLDVLVETIEDLGYECTVQECVPYAAGDDKTLSNQSRSVKLSIKGMFCEHCPPRITEAVQRSFSDHVVVEKEPTLRDPIMEVTYEPKPPNLTIRHVISTISKINESFSVTVYHPPTLEQRSQAMQLKERRRLLLRLLLSFLIAIPTLLIGVVWMSLVPSTNATRMYLEQPMWAGSVARLEWALFILSTPVFFFAADVFHVRAVREIRALWRRSSKVPMLRRFYRFGSMNLLISAGTSVAYVASLALLILDATTEMTMAGMSGNRAGYFDTVVFLTFFILIGRFLEAYSKAKTGDAVSALGKLRPSKAILVTPRPPNNENPEVEANSQPYAQTFQENVDVDLLEAGDTVLIPHGVSPPADGTVVAGSSQFDESSLTGESRPINKAVGDDVFAGSINTGKAITIKITGVNGTSMLDKIVTVVREGQTRRAPVERVADILTGYFVPIITLLAVLTFIIWFSLGQSGALPTDYLDTDRGGWAFWSLEFAIAVFVVACPCGIGLAAPTALFVGSGLAAKHGILVRGGGEAFQEASNLDVVVFDKTGTLTEGGSLKVTDYDMLASDEKETAAWAVARVLEESSGHPIAKAVVELCKEKGYCDVQTADVEEVPGYGLRGIITLNTTEKESRVEAAIGNESFMASLGVNLESYFTSVNLTRWKTEGKSIAILAMRDLQDPDSSFTVAAQFATTDPIRPEASHVIQKILESGMSVYMLSGDNLTTARSVGQAIGIPTSNIIAGVLPTEKADKIRWLQANAPKRGSSTNASKRHANRKANVAFVGDGINDAPALTSATVGIAIGSGADIALSSSSFILLTSNLLTLLTLLDLSKTVFRRIKFNFAWALVYNVCLIPVAAGIIYPAAGHPRLGPVWASAAMALSSVSVVLSSLALRMRVPGLGFRAAKGVVRG